MEITRIATWNSSDTLLSRVFPGGLAIGYRPGVVTIKASLFGVTSPPVPLSMVPSSSPDGILVTPFTVTAQVGQVLQFAAKGYFQLDGGWFDITRVVEWVNGNPGVVTLTPSGLATVVGQGFSSILAMWVNTDNSAVARGVTLTTTLTPPLTRPTVRPVLLEALDKPLPLGAEVVIESYWNAGVDWTEQAAGIKLRVERTVPQRIAVPFIASDLSNMLSGIADSQPLYNWLWVNTPLNRDGVQETWVLFWWGWNGGPHEGPVSSSMGYMPVTFTELAFVSEWATYAWMLAAGLVTSTGQLTISPNAGVGVTLHEMIHAIANVGHEDLGSIMAGEWVLWPNTVIGPIALEGLLSSPYRIE